MKTKAPMETETMARLYLELSQVVGDFAKTRREIVLEYALMQCALYFRDRDPMSHLSHQDESWKKMKALCFAALENPTLEKMQDINSEYFRILPILDPPLPFPLSRG